MSASQRKLAKKITVKSVPTKGNPKKNVGGACDCT